MNKKEMEKRIPKGTYCYDENGLCPWWSRNDDQPDQENGHCAYLEEGDWENPGLGLLWDQVKECGVNDDWEV
jgi:hypothetical protein